MTEGQWWIDPYSREFKLTFNYAGQLSVQDYAPKLPTCAERPRVSVSPLIREILFDGAQARPSFTSEKPLSKRKRRRLRGKGGTK